MANLMQNIPKDLLEKFEEFGETHLFQVCSDITGAGEGTISIELQESFILIQKKEFKESHHKAKQVFEKIQSILNNLDEWPNIYWRQAIIISALLLCFTEIAEGHYYGAIARLDFANGMGGPTDIINPLILYVNPLAKQYSKPVYTEADSIYIITNQLPENAPNLSTTAQIPRVDNITVDKFTNDYFNNDAPVVISGAVSDWKALTVWSDLRYFDKEFGHRIVNLEIGNILEGHWVSRGERLSTFIHKYLIPSNKSVVPETAALSPQHLLFDQNPELKEFFTVPLYASVGVVVNTITLMETKDTIVPMHYDAYDNLIVQVAGFTYVRLYPQNQTKFLYSHLRVPGKSESDVFKLVTVKQSTNMTMIDVENPDIKKFPLLKEASFTEAILSPGDALYIPRKYWYHRRSLTTSISIDFCM